MKRQKHLRRGGDAAGGGDGPTERIYNSGGITTTTLDPLLSPHCPLIFCRGLLAKHPSRFRAHRAVSTLRARPPCRSLRNATAHAVAAERVTTRKLHHHIWLLMANRACTLRRFAKNPGESTSTSQSDSTSPFLGGSLSVYRKRQVIGGNAIQGGRRSRPMQLRWSHLLRRHSGHSGEEPRDRRAGSHFSPVPSRRAPPVEGTRHRGSPGSPGSLRTCVHTVQGAG